MSGEFKFNCSLTFEEYDLILSVLDSQLNEFERLKTELGYIKETYGMLEKTVSYINTTKMKIEELKGKIKEIISYTYEE